MPALTTRSAATLAGAAAGLGLFTTALGRQLPQVIVDTDARISAWIVRHRRPPLNRLTRLWTGLTDTSTAILLTAAAVVALRRRLGRWREPAVVLTCMGGELAIFLVSAQLVGRARPTISHLDHDPPTSSYPSGHTSAAMALYGSLAAIAANSFDLPPAARAACRAWWVMPLMVATSRVYRGMHHPSDVVAGAVVGGTWTVLVLRTLQWE